MSPRTSPTDFPSTTANLYSAVIACNERGLVQERLLLAAIIEESQEAIFSVTVDGIVTTWNNAAVNMFGYSTSEILGKPNSLLVPPDYMLEEEILVDDICHGHLPPPFRTMRKHKHGDGLHVTLTLSPVKNAVGKVVGVSTIARWTSDPEQIVPEPIPAAAVLPFQETLRTEGFTSAAEATQHRLCCSYDATVENWSRILDRCDKETERHNRRVTSLMVRLARHVGMNAEEILFAKWGAQLHDIGKMAVPDEILHKRGPLNVEEWVAIRRHPAIAYEMLAPIEFLGSAVDIAYCHHEKWDGTGYPRGIKGTAIPFAARLFAVIDVYDALCSDRSYRESWPRERVREYLRQQAGSHFDPQAVAAFLEMPEENEALPRAF